MYYNFLENEAEIRTAIKPFAEKYNFQVSISKDQPNGWFERISFFNEKCRFDITNDWRYEEISLSYFIDPQTETNNQYSLLQMARLRSLISDDADDDETDSEDSGLADIEDFLQFVDLHFSDVLDGKFANLDNEGY